MLSFVILSACIALCNRGVIRLDGLTRVNNSWCSSVYISYVVPLPGTIIFLFVPCLCIDIKPSQLKEQTCILLHSSQHDVTLSKLKKGAFQLPHGHELHVLVENGFNAMDVDKNGELSQDELAKIYYNEDLNHDGNLTLAEYAAYWKTTPDVLAPIFNVWDTDKDGYVQATHLLNTAHLLDPNGDGIVSKHEYTHYMTGFLECVYSHGEHGHGPNCDH